MTDLPLFYSDDRPNATRFAPFRAIRQISPAIRCHQQIRGLRGRIFRQTAAKPLKWPGPLALAESVARPPKKVIYPTFRFELQIAPGATNLAIERHDRHNRTMELVSCIRVTTALGSSIPHCVADG